MNIGNRIRRFRRTLGMTQAELAKKLDLTKTGVASWEQGRAATGTDCLHRRRPGG